MVTENVRVMHIAPGQWAKHMRIYHRECLTLYENKFHVILAAHKDSADLLSNDIEFYSLGDRKPETLKWNLVNRFFRNQKAFFLAIKSNVKILEFHSPEFIPWALLIKKTQKIAIIFDCMEDFPNYVLQRGGIPNRLRLILKRFVSDWINIAAKNFDAIIVADEGTEKTLKNVSKRTLILHNFPQKELFPDPGAVSDQPYDLVFHGSLHKYYLEEIMNIDHVLIQNGYRLKWRLFGRIVEPDWFTRELVRRGSSDRFFISGLLPHDQTWLELIKAKIGIIPLPDYPKFQNNIPQKLFEFMALRIPVVMSELAPSKPFLESSKCGIMVRPGNYHAYAEAIISLIDNPDLRKQFGENGRRKFDISYNWEIESKKLIDLYNDFLTNDFELLS